MDEWTLENNHRINQIHYIINLFKKHIKLNEITILDGESQVYM